MRKCLSLAAASIVLLTFAGLCGADDSPAEPEPQPGWRVGGDIYYGLSNWSGPSQRLTDGLWAGAYPSLPSTLALDWTGSRGLAARVSLGIGDIYTGSERTVKQPVECLVRMPAGSGSLTLGKHYTVFGLQEWEYETRWGALLEGPVGGGSGSVCLTHNPDTEALNGLVRLARPIGEKTEVGLSVGAGRGWSFSSSHDWGYGLDATTETGPLTLTGEVLVARGPGGTFEFWFAKARMEARRGWRPYVAAFYGLDRAEEMGDLRSYVAGVEIDAAPHLTLDPGVSRSGGRTVWWVQAHVTF